MDNLLLQSVGDYVVLIGIGLTIAVALYLIFTNFVLPALMGKNTDALLSSDATNLNGIYGVDEVVVSTQVVEEPIKVEETNKNTKKKATKQTTTNKTKKPVAKAQVKSTVKAATSKKAPTQKSKQPSKQTKKKSTSK